MTITQWMKIIQAYEQGDEQPFQSAYQTFQSKFKPLFFKRYDGLDIDFNSIFNDKFLEIFNRTLNHTLIFKKPN